MRIGVPSVLCDAVEIAAMHYSQGLTIKDLVRELGEGVLDRDMDAFVQDAIGIAEQRSRLCGDLYPFIVSSRKINYIGSKNFNIYSYLLLGSFLKIGGSVGTAELLREFRSQFEDVVCWCMRKAGCRAEVLSIPRAERGLPVSLIPALETISQRLGERAILTHGKITGDDNDLGVDVIATLPAIDQGRSGRPIMLIQCATGAITNLHSKLGEKANVFSAAWQNGFYRDTSIRSGATPDDLYCMEAVHWDRLSEQAWILDRLRLVQLVLNSTHEVIIPSGFGKTWKRLYKGIENVDWKNGWRGEL